MEQLLAWIRKYWRWLVYTPLLLFLMLQIYFFLQIGWWVNHNPTSTSFMRQQLAVLQKKNPGARLKQADFAESETRHHRIGGCQFYGP